MPTQDREAPGHFPPLISVAVPLGKFCPHRTHLRSLLHYGDGMHACPRCLHTQHWILSDRRVRCTRCRHRWRPLSAWDAIRSPESTKRALLHRFASSVPCYRNKEGVAGAPTAARFYQHARATCALDQEALKPIPQFARFLFVEMALEEGSGQVIVKPHLCRPAIVNPGALAKGSHTIQLCGTASAFGTWRFQNGRLVLAGAIPSHFREHNAPVLQRFWHGLMQTLKRRRHIPATHVHLHVGEFAFRWNHGERALALLLEERMRRLPIEAVRALLVRNREDISTDCDQEQALTRMDA